MYQEGSSLSAIARIFGVSVQAVSQWVKRGRAARSRMRRRGAKRTAGVVGNRPAAVVAFDEMWTYRQARRRGQRQDVWVWMAVVWESDGSRWADFELGDRSAETFLRLYERLPEAKLYRTDAYQVYDWLPVGRHEVGKDGAVNWNERLHSWCRGKLNRLHRRTKVHERRGDAGVFVGFAAGGLAFEILHQFMLRIPASPQSCPRNRRRVQYSGYYARIKTNFSCRRVAGDVGEGTTLWDCI